MYTSVWVVTFTDLKNRRFVLGVYSTCEKAVQAVEQAADDSGQWINRKWLSRGWAVAYDDENMMIQAGVYDIIMHDLQ